MSSSWLLCLAEECIFAYSLPDRCNVLFGPLTSDLFAVTPLAPADA